MTTGGTIFTDGNPNYFRGNDRIDIEITLFYVVLVTKSRYFEFKIISKWKSM